MDYEQLEKVKYLIDGNRIKYTVTQVKNIAF